MSMKGQRVLWAVAHRNGTLVVVDGRAPLFWKRRLAREFAEDRGFDPDRDVRICRVRVSADEDGIR